MMAVNENNEISVAKVIHREIKARNITHVFGYSGGVIIPLLDEFYDGPVKIIMNRNEQCCGHAAEGYAKASNKVGVTITTSGPGVTNLITPLQDAMNDGVPLLSLTGQVPTTEIGREAFQECYAVALTSSCTKWSYQIKTETEVQRCVDKAFRIATSGRKGPVHLDIPADILKRNISECPDSVMALDNREELLTVDNENNVRKVMYLIQISKKPVIFAGQGALNCSETLRCFAVSFNIPVTTSLLAMGVFDETHPLALKMVGDFGHPAANYAIQQADLILAIGSRFNDRVTGTLSKYAPEARLAQQENRGGFVHFNINTYHIGKLVEPAVALKGDCEVYMKALLDLHRTTNTGINTMENVKSEKDGGKNQMRYLFPLGKMQFWFTVGGKSIPQRKEWLNQIQKWKGAFDRDKQYPNVKNGKLYPQQVVTEINKQTSNKNDFLFTTGVGCHQMIACQYIDWQYPRSIISSGSLGVMGVSTPFAIGAQLASPTKTVISIDGDGSFNMTAQDLSTIVEHNIPVKIALIDDSALTMVRHNQVLATNRNVITKNANPDYIKLGEAYGIHTIYCDQVRHLERCVKDLISFKGPVCCIFKTDSQFSFPHVYPGKALDEIAFYQDKRPK